MGQPIQERQSSLDQRAGLEPLGFRLSRFLHDGAPYLVLSCGVGAWKPTRELTPTELSIYRDVYAGYSSKEIAQRRGRSVRTIENQIASIFRKLGIHSRGELVLRRDETLRILQEAKSRLGG